MQDWTVEVEMRLVNLILICLVAWIELATKNLVAGISMKQAPRRRLSHRKIYSHNNKAPFVKSNNDGMKRSIYKLRIHYMPENDNIVRAEAAGRTSNKIEANNRRSQNFFKSHYEKEGKLREEQTSNRATTEFERDAKRLERLASTKSMGGEQEMTGKMKQKKTENSGESFVIKEEVNKDQQQQNDEKNSSEKVDGRQKENKKGARENKENSVKGDREKALQKNDQGSSKSESNSQYTNISKEHLHESEKIMSEQTAKGDSDGKDNKGFRAEKEGNEEWKKNEEEDKGKRNDKMSQEERKQSKIKNSRDEEMNTREDEMKNATNGLKENSNKTEVNETVNGKSKMEESHTMEDQTFDEDENMGKKEREINNKGKYTTRGNKWYMERYNKGSQKNVDQGKKLEREYDNINSKGNRMASKNEQVISANINMKANDSNGTSTEERNRTSQLSNNNNTAKQQNMHSNPKEVAGKERFSNSSKSTNKGISSTNTKDNETRTCNTDDGQVDDVKTQNNTNNTTTEGTESNKSNNSSATRNNNKTAKEEKKESDEMNKGNWAFKEKEGDYEPLEDKIKKADKSNKGYKQRNEENMREENTTTNGNDKGKGVNATATKGEKNKGNKIDQSALGFGEKKEEMSDGDQKMIDNHRMTEDKIVQITESNGRSKNERMLKGNLQNDRIGKSEMNTRFEINNKGTKRASGKGLHQKGGAKKKSTIKLSGSFLIDG